MRRLYSVLIGVAALVSSSATASDAVPRTSQDQKQSPFMRIHGQALPPIGYVQFCERHPFDCEPTANEQARIELTTQRLSELDTINRTINRTIEPASDLELYGVEEYWEYPDARQKGDCEDYVLLKRKQLIALGWPHAALLITVVMDERNEGHAILSVRTAQGDFVLDNKNDEIKPWYRTPYRYVMRQSFIHPRIWVSLEPKEQKAVPVAGVKRSR